MKASLLLNALILLLHLVLVCVLWQVLTDRSALLAGAELLIVLSLISCFALLHRIRRPLRSIERGMDMLRDEDYSSLLAKTGYKDVDELIRVFNGMIARLREEKISIREQHHFLDLLISSSPVGLVVMDFNLCISAVNPAAEKILETESAELIGRGMEALPAKLQALLQEIKSGEKTKWSPDTRRFLVHRNSFMDHGFRRSFFLIEELTSEIIQAEKQAYGKVIRMMAHEVNNTLGAVNSILSAVKTDVQESEMPQADALDQILGTALERNHQLNKFMQNYANLVKLPLPERKPFALYDSLHTVADSLSFVMEKQDIGLEMELAGPSPTIYADRSQIDLVFANLLKNAIEAIGKGGQIALRVRRAPLSLHICDNGPGIPEDIRDQLFTPFFSTKAGGQGIGLTLCREVLENHGFRLCLHHSVKGDTAFLIEF